MFDSITFANAGVSLGIICLFGILLSLGRKLEPALRLERLGIPIALLAGLLALLLGPFGPFLLIPLEVSQACSRLPTLVVAEISFRQGINND